LLADQQARAFFANRARDYVQSEHSHRALKDYLTKLYSLALAT
jgi:hypothetical protein